MSRSPLLAPWALPLWGLLFLALLAALAPRQVGQLAEQALPGVLHGLSQSLGGQVTLESYQRNWRQAQARILLNHAQLHAPVLLDASLRHGPWLGEEGFGWLSARILWPEQGGIAPFPPGERLELRFKTDLLGRSRLCLWRLKGKSADKLGEVRIEIDTPHNQTEPPPAPGAGAVRLTGETHLPGLVLLTRQGELRLAEVDLRLRLHQVGERLAGTVGLDARRAALKRGEGAWLIEQPWLDVTLGERNRLEWRWASLGGRQELGYLGGIMSWRNVDWAALHASLDRRAWRLDDTMRLRRQLDRLGLALGGGEIVLERLTLEHPRGRFELEGLLRGREAPTGLRRLHLDLRLAVERPLAVHLLGTSRWVQDAAAAERLLSVLEEQHILVEHETMLHGALTLWDGALTLSGRPMVLEKVLDAPLNSDGMD